MKRALLGWLGVNLLLLAYVVVQSRPALPQPRHWHSVTLERADGHLTLRYQQPQWTLNGQAVKSALLDTLQHLLRHECVYAFPEAEFTLTPHNPRHFQLDEQRYTVSNHNSYLNAHYVHHAGEVYLCHERLKSLISTPREQWLLASTPPES